MAIHVARPARAWCRMAILATAICGAVHLRAGAATVDSTFTGTSGGDWTTATNWSPAGIPNNGGGNVYDVTAPLDDGVTLSNASISINNFSVPDAANALAPCSPPLTILPAASLLINGRGKLARRRSVWDLLNPPRRAGVPADLRRSGQHRRQRAALDGRASPTTIRQPKRSATWTGPSATTTHPSPGRHIDACVSTGADIVHAQQRQHRHSGRIAIEFHRRKRKRRAARSRLADQRFATDLSGT